MSKCYICEKGNLEQKKVPYDLLDEKVGLFDAEVCTACGEVFFNEETSRKITAATKVNTFLYKNQFN